MRFRFSIGNVIAGVGVLIFGAATVALLRSLVGKAADASGGFNGWLADRPWWVFVLAGIAGLLIAFVGGIIQGIAQQLTFELFEEYAAENGWGGFPTPRWVFDSRTFPLDGHRELAVSDAYVGDFGGFWAATLLAENVGGVKGSESLGSYQIIGFPFNDDMPRLHVMPRDTVESTREMLGGERINFESDAFNALWRVRGDDAKRVHDILHPRTLERLTMPDAQGIPVIIDGGAIWSWTARPVVGEDLERVLRLLLDVATSIPPFVYRDLNVELLPKRSDNLHADWVLSRRSAGIAQRDEADSIDG